MWTKTELAYLAGVMDCDGTISIYKGGNRGNLHRDYVLRFYVVNTRIALIDWLQKKFEGSVYKRQPKNANWNTKYEWILEKRKLDKLMPFLRPYMVIKNKQLELAIDFRKSFHPSIKPGQSRPDTVWKYREKCFVNMRSFNRVGIHSLS